MGSRVLRFTANDTADNVTVLVEIDDPTLTGNVAVSQRTAERARRSLEDALEDLRPGVEAMMTKIRTLGRKPDEVGMEFGIKFTAEANALIAKTALEGNVKVTLKWKEAEK